MSSTKPPAGTRDFLPDDVRRREHVIGIVRSVYERYGFEPLETPAYENIETLLGKYGDEGNKLIFKILKRGEHEASGEADLALRYDLTVPLARVVAQYQNDLPKFFKRYQIQPVWRADRPARGRYREFYQCDVDAMGSTSPVVEVELLSAVSEVLTTLGFADFVIRLNHRALLAALLTTAGIDVALREKTIVAIDKFDKIGVDGVVAELVAAGIAAASADRVVDVFRLGAAGGAAGSVDPAANGTRLATLRSQVGQDASGLGAVDNLEQIVELSAGTPAAGHVAVDSTLARGLSYYTGAIMEIAVADLAGSLGGGGRYDNLIGMFLGHDVPACGFSLGLERIILVMTERQMFPSAVAGRAPEVLVTLWNETSRSDGLALGAELRRSGLRVEIYPDADRIGKQFKYASARQIPYVAVVGDDERASGQVTIKDMTTGEQTTMRRETAASYIGGRR